MGETRGSAELRISAFISATNFLGCAVKDIGGEKMLLVGLIGILTGGSGRFAPAHHPAELEVKRSASHTV